ncbi:hypothetical protein [Nocardioides cynanchi]|uniref:hypothetical protein n=1 Tax=Nocardioides cynanchi TaxID=2558918 RepID=UPI00124405E5|nr:hypothetical protein [Nocardioides cynanchi]
MAWFFRAIETVQGTWGCHHGAQLFDEHTTLDEALAHLRALAAELQPVGEIFIHPVGGQVRADCGR